jgi:two-component system sensor histidine kinase UhpB
MSRLSLRARLSLAFAGLLALLVALDAALTLRGAGRRIDPEVANATALTREILREAVRGLHDGPDLDRRLAGLAASLDRLRHVRVSYRAPGAAAPAPEPGRATSPEWFVALIRPRAASSEIPVAADGRSVGAFVVAGDPADEIGELWDSLVTLTLDGLASAALGLAVFYALARAALAPLTRLNAGLAALGRGDYAARLPEAAAPEFQPLLARFNALGASLAQAEAENRVLRGQLVSIQDEERKEIGRELHDEIGPHLFAARAQAGAARRAAGEAAAPALDALTETLAALQATNRRILERLRPAALEELGLAAALEALARLFERNGEGFAVTVAVGPLPALPPGLEAALYRIAQEALTNAARHAQATRASVALTAGPGALLLVVQDDGRGLDPARPPGRGLIGMRERVAAYGGALRLVPARPRGVALEAEFPLR